ncbi:hypothetical protein T479_16950 [Lysinibacillus varians]|nr:hypothetical protein T479_16950 [Lysinibacillus varians]
MFALLKQIFKEDFLLDLYEEKFAEFSVLGGKVNVIDEYSFDFIQKQFEFLRTDIYLDMFFNKSILWFNNLNYDERIFKINEFFNKATSFVVERELTENELIYIKELIDLNKIEHDLNNYRDILDIILNIVRNIQRDKDDSFKFLINFHQEKLIIEFFTTVTEIHSLNLNDEIKNYFLNKNSFKGFGVLIKNLLSNSYKLEWFIPCHLAYIESSLIIDKLGILRQNDLLDLIKSLPEKLSTQIKLDKKNNYYFYCKIDNTNIDIEHSIFKVKTKSSELLDIMYFGETWPFKTNFNWNEAFCIVSNENENRSIIYNGLKAKYSPSLDNDQALKKLIFIETFRN